MINFLFFLFRAVNIGVGCLYLLVTILLFFPFFSRESQKKWIGHFAKLCLKILGFKLEIISTNEIEKAQNYLVASNHISFIDAFALCAVYPAAFIAKSEIAQWPLIGFVAKRAQTIFIDRTQRRAVSGIVDAMSKALKRNENVTFFPEATTSSGKGLLPFHPSLFESAVLSKVPTLPVAIEYLDEEGKKTTIPAYVDDDLGTVLKRILMTRGLKVRLTIGEAIVGNNDRLSLCQEVSRQIATILGVEDETAKKTKELASKQKQAG